MAKEHKVQVIVGDVRYIAIERDGKVTISKGGDDAGRATWKEDHFEGSTSMLPDSVIQALEAKIKEAIDDED